MVERWNKLKSFSIHHLVNSYEPIFLLLGQYTHAIGYDFLAIKVAFLNGIIVVFQ